MPSVTKRIASEIAYSAPNLSFTEISNQIVHIIEKSILPDVINSLVLPTLPSPVTVKREEFREERYGKRTHRSISDKVRFIQDLEKMRNYWNGSDTTDQKLKSIYEPTTNGIPKIYPEPRLNLEYLKEPSPPEPTPVVEQLLSSSSPINPNETITSSKLIEFNSNIVYKIVNSPLYEKLLGSIESKIRKNFNQKDLFFNFYVRVDADYPDEEQIIIDINFKSAGFKEKMELWDKVETALKDVIDNLGLSENERKKINRNVFTNVKAD